MHVIITSHVKQRIRENRQSGITLQDIIYQARSIPGTVPIATRFRGFLSVNGRVFDMVVKDIAQGRLVITVIGK